MLLFSPFFLLCSFFSSAAEEKIIEFNNPKMAELVKEIVEQNGFTDESFQFNIFGLCEKHKD